MSVTPGLMDHAQLRVVIAEDAVLLREGLRRVLTDAGLDVAGTAGDAEQLLSLVTLLRPDVVLTDIRMPPTQTTEGLQAALEIRRQWPGTAVIVLSHHPDLPTPVSAGQLPAMGWRGSREAGWPARPGRRPSP